MNAFDAFYRRDLCLFDGREAAGSFNIDHNVKAMV